MRRRAARELVLKTLYEIEIGKMDPSPTLDRAVGNSELPAAVKDWSRRVVEGTLRERAAIDDKIAGLSLGWSVDRMAAVDRNLLRMAIYELFYEDEIPYSVTVNEAVELAKKYGDADSPKFVNGILGTVIRTLSTV